MQMKVQGDKNNCILLVIRKLIDSRTYGSN